MGIDSYSNPFRKSQGFEQLLIISPFLSKDALETFSDKEMTSGKLYLFSREEELAHLSEETLAPFECYALSNLIVDSVVKSENDSYTFEDDLEIESNGLASDRTHNLHAKMFIGEKQEKTHWFLGSANCSTAALRYNQEFLIELVGEDDRLSVEHVLIDLLGPEDNRNDFFVKYKPKTREEKPNPIPDFRKVTTYFLLLVQEGGLDIQLDVQENEKYTISISLTKKIDNQFDDHSIHLVPYGCQEELKLLTSGHSCTFQNISLHNLSKFLRVRISKENESDTFLIKTELELPEKRIDHIIKSIISNRENFFRLLQFLLGDTSVESFVSNEDSKSASLKNGGHWLTNQPILEKFMKAASRNPEILKDIEAIISRLGSDSENKIIPPDFLEFWSVFKKRIKL